MPKKTTSQCTFLVAEDLGDKDHLSLFLDLPQDVYGGQQRNELIGPLGPRCADGEEPTDAVARVIWLACKVLRDAKAPTRLGRFAWDYHRPRMAQAALRKVLQATEVALKEAEKSLPKLPRRPFKDTTTPPRRWTCPQDFQERLYPPLDMDDDPDAEGEDVDLFDGPCAVPIYSPKT